MAPNHPLPLIIRKDFFFSDSCTRYMEERRNKILFTRENESEKKKKKSDNEGQFFFGI